MNATKEFMMIFRFTPDFSNQPSPEELEGVHQAWGKFIGNIAIKEKLVSTHQLGFEGRLIQSNNDVSTEINIAEGKTLGGNMIVRANSFDEAVSLAQECPILHIGGTVEIRNILPMS